jgi:hypothetical protein
LTVVDTTDDFVIKTDLQMPGKFTFGAGLGESKKWLLGAQITMKDAGTLANNYNEMDNVSYVKSRRYSIGGYYIPKYNSFSGFAKRIVYRGGFKYEKTGLVVNSEDINDVGVTLGAGMPISGSFSNINIGFEFGKKGTTSSNLVQENYATISVGMSLNDRWFEKRKFN